MTRLPPIYENLVVPNQSTFPLEPLVKINLDLALQIREDYIDRATHRSAFFSERLLKTAMQECMVATEYLKQQPPVMKPGSTRRWVDPIFFKKCRLPEYSTRKPFDGSQLSLRLRRCLALAEALLLQGFNVFQLQTILRCCSSIRNLTLTKLHEHFRTPFDFLEVPLSLAGVHCSLDIAFQTKVSKTADSPSPSPVFRNILFTRLTTLSLDITEYVPEILHKWNWDYSHLTQLSSLWIWNLSQFDRDLSHLDVFIKKTLLPRIPSNLEFLAVGIAFRIPMAFKPLLDGSLHRKLVVLLCKAEYRGRDYLSIQRQTKNYPEIVEVDDKVHAAWRNKEVKQQVQEVVRTREQRL
ncbi:hypothetical protein DL96DRAFT_1611281 [Flagelloscypha sp. PMI_526]|nr:hypothetical protein DL96DRAFT_1611281 [Flagelloscypha sp. PMI_526]